MIIDGWLDWAIKLPGPTHRNLNDGINPVRGIFMHSAEGYAGTLLDPNSQWGYAGNHSWHLSNLFDGRVFQHYPFTARCHHATAANQSYIGVENEGDFPKETTLNEAQIVNAQRFIKEIADWKGWLPTRPKSSSDISHTLWEHNEVVRLGGTSSACPSGRIPWEKLLKPVVPPVPPTGSDKMIRLNRKAIPANDPEFWTGKQVQGRQGINVRGDMQLDPSFNNIVLDIILRSGHADIRDGSGHFAGAVGGASPLRAQVEVIIDSNGYAIMEGDCVVDLIGMVGYRT